MAKVGYIFKAIDNDSLSTAQEWMEDFGCIRIIEENVKDEKLRPKWMQLMEMLKRGDELVVIKFSNALRETAELSLLVEFCRVNNVRLVSIEDKIDTQCKIFPHTTALDVLFMVGSLPEDTLAVRQHEQHNRFIKNAAMAYKEKVQPTKANREQNIVNMYVSGYTLEDIQKVSGFTSRSSIFRILNKHGVELNRGNFSGKLGPRRGNVV